LIATGTYCYYRNEQCEKFTYSFHDLNIKFKCDFLIQYY